jgi:hypothetical protein
VTGVRTKTAARSNATCLPLPLGSGAPGNWQTAALRTDQGILVDDRLQTSDPSIYSAGDVAQVFDPFSKYVLDSLWGLARGRGRWRGQTWPGERPAIVNRSPSTSHAWPA